MSAATMKGHHAPSDCGDAAAALPPSSLKNCDCSISAALGTAPGASEAQGHAIACTARVTASGIGVECRAPAEGKIRERDERDRRDERGDIERDGRGLRPGEELPLRESPVGRARGVSVEQPRDVRRRVHELGVDAGRPRTGIQHCDEILDAPQARHTARQQHERERQQHELHADQEREHPYDVDGLRAVVRERRERNRDARNAADRRHRDRDERAEPLEPRACAGSDVRRRAPPPAAHALRRDRVAECAARCRGRAARARRTV